MECQILPEHRGSQRDTCPVLENRGKTILRSREGSTEVTARPRPCENQIISANRRGQSAPRRTRCQPGSRRDFHDAAFLPRAGDTSQAPLPAPQPRPLGGLQGRRGEGTGQQGAVPETAPLGTGLRQAPGKAHVAWSTELAATTSRGLGQGKPGVCSAAGILRDP